MTNSGVHAGYLISGGGAGKCEVDDKFGVMIVYLRKTGATRSFDLWALSAGKHACGNYMLAGKVFNVGEAA